MERKFTDDEIEKALKALERIADSTPPICNYEEGKTEPPFCKPFEEFQEELKLALDHINRQKAEIERLRIDSTYADNFARDLCEKRLLNGKEIADFGDLQEYIEDQKAEAIKAFAVRLKEPFEIFTDAREADALYMVGLIDTLVKEMTEDTK